MADTVHCKESPFQMASSETLPLGFDTTNLLGSGETPSLPTVTLTNTMTGASYAAGLSGSPTISGNVVKQTVTSLVAGQTYRMAVSFTAATSKVWTMLLDIQTVA